MGDSAAATEGPPQTPCTVRMTTTEGDWSDAREVTITQSLQGSGVDTELIA